MYGKQAERNIYTEDRNKFPNRPWSVQYDPICIFNISGIGIKQSEYFHTTFFCRFLRFHTNFFVHIHKSAASWIFHEYHVPENP